MMWGIPDTMWLDRAFQTADRGGTLVLALASAAVAWAMLLIIYSTTDLHHDLTELYAWSLNPDWGHDKHPPLAAWLTAAWFSIFPTTDWAFKLLAALNAALGLYSVDLVARQFVRDEKRFYVLLLLILTPVYWFHGLRFNPTTLLLWTWPLAMACFLRAFETRAAAWAIAAGIAAAVAMLAKYTSAILIASFLVAALTSPQRRKYLSSASPWISAGVGLLVLAPHIAWLLAGDAGPIAFPLMAHGAATLSSSLVANLRFLLSGVAYVAPMLATYLILARPRLSDAVAALWPRDPHARMLAAMFISIVVLMTAASVAIKIRPISLWLLPCTFPLPILLLRSTGLDQVRARYLAFAVTAVAVAVLVGGGPHAWYRHLTGDRDRRQHYQLLAQEVGRAWRESTDQKLRFVGGDRKIATGISFYHPDHPRLASSLGNYRLTLQSAIDAGGVLVCPSFNTSCISEMRKQAMEHKSARPWEIELARTIAGVRGIPERYMFTVVRGASH